MHVCVEGCFVLQYVVSKRKIVQNVLNTTVNVINRIISINFLITMQVNYLSRSIYVMVFIAAH